MVKSKKPIAPERILGKFALMCQKSKTLDGDWQGDGWGIAYQIKNWEWRLYQSLAPIWEDQGKFFKFPKTKMFVVHARSASFQNQKGKIEYNQPYVDGGHCFVFNGTVKGVRLKRKIRGEIGAQKIFYLLLNNLQISDPAKSLRRLEELLLKNSRLVEGLNIGLAFKERFFVLCQYQPQYRHYFSIRYNKDDELKMVVSEKIGEDSFRRMRRGEIKIF